MNEKIKAIQGILGVTDDGVWGPNTQAALDQLINPPPTEEIAPMPVPVPFDDGQMHISTEGLDLVKTFEGWYPHAYKDEVGVWTIGWGHTGLTHQDGTVYAGREITREEGELLLRHDMSFFEDRVRRHVKVPLTQEQFDALVSFDFNTGGLASSTLLKLNQGNYNEAADQFLRWDKAGGKVLRGLTRRRKSERNRFLGKVPFIVED